MFVCVCVHVCVCVCARVHACALRCDIQFLCKCGHLTQTLSNTEHLELHSIHLRAPNFQFLSLCHSLSVCLPPPLFLSITKNLPLLPPPLPPSLFLSLTHTHTHTHTSTYTPMHRHTNFLFLPLSHILIQYSLVHTIFTEVQRYTGWTVHTVPPCSHNGLTATPVTLKHKHQSVY